MNRVPTGGRARTRVSPLLQPWLLRCSSNGCLVIRAPFKHLSLCIVNIYICYGYNSLKISVTFCFDFIQYHHNHDNILYTRFHGKWDDITYMFSENILLEMYGKRNYNLTRKDWNLSFLQRNRRSTKHFKTPNLFPDFLHTSLN